MTTILCYGDSNTYGYNPVNGLRYPKDVRWTGVLQKLLGEQYAVIEEGCNGRTTVFEDIAEPWKAGLGYLKPCLNTHKPIDFVIMMLGSNDLKRMFHASAKEIADGAEQLVSIIKEFTKEKNINFLFEASCGGGIPIIRALNSSLTADEIDEITGILNGTTNYMLYKMSTENCDFDTVLKEAQAKGYAEADPTADVGGADACRKIAILSSLAYGKFLNYEDIYTEGITKITPADMEYAKELGMTIKLLATSRRIGDSFYAMVAPFLVGQSSPLYSVNDVFNAVFVHGNVLGDAMFYGSGAGKLPTASAVVADVVDEAKHLHRNIMTNWSSYALKLMDMDEVEGRFFVRVSDTTMDEVEKAFGDVQTIEPDDLPDEFGFITPVMKQAEYYEKISKLTGKVLAMIRVKD